MERARKSKKRAGGNLSNSVRKKTTKTNAAEKPKGPRQQSLLELFAVQQRKLESKFISLQEDNSSDFCEIIELTEAENRSKDEVLSTEKVVKDEINQNANSQINDNKSSDEIVDPNLKEFFEEDDSIFSSIDAENTSHSSSQQLHSTSPYYVENFKKVIHSVFHDPFFSYLFDETDRSTVDLYINKLTLPQQKLYSRVYLRKYRWLRLDQILYNDIGENITTVANGLVTLGMLEDASSLANLSDALKCLNASEMKALAKSLQMNSNLSRKELVCTIERHSKKNSIATFFSKDSPALEDVVLNKIKQQLGPCYRLETSIRSTFIRMMMLSSLCNTVSDDDFSGQQQIFQMLSTSIGLTKYPDYDLCRKSKVYLDRQSLIRYVELLDYESRLWQKCESKKYDEALKVYQDAKETFASRLHDDAENEHVMTLPSHLRTFTCGAAYVRILNRGVNVLQSLKMFDAAVVQLKELLQQRCYHLDYRGRWYDRLTLNLDFHLKQPAEAMRYIVDALNDPNVRTGHRFDVLMRGKKILSSKSKKMEKFETKETILDDEMNLVKEAPNVTITGHQLPRPVPSGGSVWVFGREDFTVMSGVERFAIEHYSRTGYDEGIHGEGLTFTCLFNLLCWDVVFKDSIPDSFYNHFQTSPLDLRTDAFYDRREAIFRERFTFLREASMSELEELLDRCWSENYGTLCSGLDWELFRDVDHVKGLVRSCGGELLSGIFERMARMMRFVTGGVPDLVVWNAELKKVKFVEVKGPGDKLSSKQILWLDYLISLGADAEVCHVKAESSKKLKT